MRRRTLALLATLALIATAFASGCDACVKGILSSDDGTCERLAAALQAGDAHVAGCRSPSTGNAASTSGQWTELVVVYGDPMRANFLDAPIVGSMAQPPSPPSLPDGKPPRQWTCKSNGPRWKELFLAEVHADPRNDATAAAVCAAFAKL